MQKKSDIILIIVTVILVGVLIGGFIYDRNDALIDRSNPVALMGDDNLEIVKVNKKGFLYYRTAYEAKIKIKDGSWSRYIIRISETYGGEGAMLDYNQYKEYEADALDLVTVKPNPRTDSFTWVLGVPLKENSTENIVYIVTMEGDNHDAYIYLYYSRK